MALKIFLSGVAVFCALAIVYVYSLYAGFFFSIWWWDIPMHIGGGVLAGLIGAWFSIIFSGRVSLLSIFAGVIVLGVAVEALEYALGFTYSPFMSYPVDTAKDLVDDLVGGVIVGYLLARV
ncbi:MAG: hypothetical protein JWM46_25 [Candidatus Kaiserbacteria bacterium]|nr:hypothetical protein [Candidatus Kaiserbacteria bacterium]